MPSRLIGLDHLGSFLVKEGSEVVKSWICLFTCLSIHATHLEWVKDSTSERFLSCFRRFVARRGKPQSEVISDNASQFKVIKTAIGLQWGKLTALTPWQVGFYERLVGLVKRSLRKSNESEMFYS